jgi:hypothetical protein
MEGTKTHPRNIIIQVEAMMSSVIRRQPKVPVPRCPVYPVTKGNEVILVDTSWDTQEMTGLGVAWYNTNVKLKHIQLQAFSASDVFHAEALALIWAIQECTAHRPQALITGYIIFSDCKNLVHVVTGYRTDEPDSWRATEAVLQTRALPHTSHIPIQLAHAHRECLALNGIVKSWNIIAVPTN